MKFELTHNNLILTLKDANELEIEQLNISLKRKIPSWKWHPKVKAGYWDGTVSYFKNNMYAPAGLWKEIIDIGKTFGMEVQIEGLKGLFDRNVVYEEFFEWANKLFEKHPSIELRDYQIESAYNIIKYKSSLSELATSAGKTVIVYLVIMHLLETQKAKRILMIVPTVDLVLQGHEDFFDYHETSESPIKLMIQQIYAGQKIKPESNIVIGTYQSLVKKKSDYFKDFDSVIVDECLHPQTNILMSDNTYKEIKNIQIGDLVKTINDKNNKVEIKEVEYVYKNLSVNNQMYELEMENGEIIKITGNHMVKLINGTYKRVDELTIEDNILSILD